MRIAVYSGSFNPLHIGHLSILRSLCSADYDKVLLVVSPQNPLRCDIGVDSSEKRYDAACRAVARHPELSGKVYVDDIELKMPAPTYSISTLDALRSLYPDAEITLTIGADNLDDIHRWKDYHRILTEFGVAVYPRKGFDLESIKVSLEEEGRGQFKISIIDAPMVNISSTAIRNRMAAGENVDELLM